MTKVDAFCSFSVVGSEISEETAILIGYVVGVSFLIIFGIVLWFVCRQNGNSQSRIRNDQNNAKTKYDPIKHHQINVILILVLI